MPLNVTSLRTRLLIVIVIAVLPALSLIPYSASVQRRLVTQEVQNEALQLARRTANDYQQLIEGGRQLLVTLAQVSSIKYDYPSECRKIYSKLLAEYPNYSEFASATPNGTVTCSDVPLTRTATLHDRPWFQSIVSAPAFVVGEQPVGQVDGRYVVALGYPILTTGGRLHSVISLDLDLGPATQRAADAVSVGGGSLSVISRDGKLLARYPATKALVGELTPEQMFQLVEAHGEGTAEAADDRGVAHLLGFAPVQLGQHVTTAFVIVRIPKEMALARADRVMGAHLAAFAIVSLLALGAARVGGEFVLLRRVNALLAVTRKLREGDLSARTGLRKGGGELDQLANAFDEMAASLQERELLRQKSEEQLRRQEMSAQALVRTAVRLNVQLDLESVLNAVCEEAARALNVPASSVRLCDDSRNVLDYVTDYGLPPEHRAQARPLPRAAYDRFMKEMGPIILLPDIQQVPEVYDAARYALLNIRSTVITSMIREGQLIGSLNVYTFEVRYFTEDALTLLHGLAHQAALAIANARMYDALKREERTRGDLLRRIITTQEDERKRIARELHDETSQNVTALMVGLEAAHIALNDDVTKLSGHLQATKKIANGMLDDVYRLISELRPSVLDDLGLAPAIASYAERRLKEAGIALRLDATGQPAHLSTFLETALFRIFQEAITNVIRHSGATVVKVRLKQVDGFLTLEIADNGRGFENRTFQAFDTDRSGLGLRGMQERAMMLGGELHVQTAPGEGAVIAVRVPIAKVEASHE